MHKTRLHSTEDRDTVDRQPRKYIRKKPINLSAHVRAGRKGGKVKTGRRYPHDPETCPHCADPILSGRSPTKKFHKDGL